MDAGDWVQDDPWDAPGLRSGQMREGVELSHAEHGSHEQARRDGYRLIPDGWERFWTEHSERATICHQGWRH